MIALLEMWCSGSQVRSSLPYPFQSTRNSLTVCLLLLHSRFSPSFLHPSPSFGPYVFTTLSLFLYPDKPFIPSLSILPLFTRVKNKTERPTAFISTIHYWYMRIGIAIVGEPSPTRTIRPTLLMRTWEPHHLRTPTTGLAMGQGLRNKEGDPPPRSTEEPTSRESNRPPARNRSIDSR